MRSSSDVRQLHSLAPAGFALLVVALVAPASARAAWTDMTGTMPGNTCRKVGSGGVLGYASDGAIYNNVAAGGVGLTVECPVPSAAQGLKTKVGTTVTYLDNSPSMISCTLQTEDNNSTSFQTWTQGSTTDDNSYATMDFKDVQGYADGHVHFRCVIPAKDNEGNPSYIIGYEIQDDDEFREGVAADQGYHTFPGSNCRQISSGSIWLTSDGAIGNTSTSAMTLDCPVAQTINSLDPDPTQAGTKLWYLDSSPSVFTCTLAAEAADSTAVNQISQSSNADDSSYRAFTFSGTKAVTQFFDGFLHFRCSVPPPDAGGAASFIVGYGLATFVP